VTYISHFGAALTFYTNQNGLEQSHPWFLLGLQAGPCSQGVIEQHFSSWSNAECSIYVKILFDSGNIAIIHDPQRDYAGFKDVEPMVREDTINFFKASWRDSYPSREDCLNISSCYLTTDQKSCVCKVEIDESQYFSTADDLISTATVHSILRYGAVHPATFDAGIYKEIGSCGISNLTVYSTNDGGCYDFTSDTIFALKLHGVDFFLKNMKSMVLINQQFAFRNPPHFINMVDPTVRDAIYETEAVIDSLFYHPNHPTFLAIRLIQRFGISNPSPSFVVRVSEAYKSGSFQDQFGSGNYGDLGAMVAAILLDPESRTPALDLDQVSAQHDMIECVR
jgi:cullin-associated NEDD8-dissociated protein 1